MKIGILTFHSAANYGAVLQAFGLQEYLISAGHQVSVINYCPDYIADSYRALVIYPESGFLKRIVSLVRSLLVFPIRSRRNARFRKFIQDKIHLSKLDLYGSQNDFDAFVLGSDQIWNHDITKVWDDIFFGNFPAACGKRIISYAASAGSVSQINSSHTEDIFITKLSAIDRISVRETFLAEYLAARHIRAEVVADPVFLAGALTFRNIARCPKRRKPYLLFFRLRLDSCLVKTAEDISRRLGLELVVITSSSESIRNPNIRQCLSPEEFIGYFYEASYIITTSYHGMAFSILFEKDFNVISIMRNETERMSSLLSILGLEDRISDQNSELKVSAVDYSEVNPKLEAFVARSRKFLDNSLSVSACESDS